MSTLTQVFALIGSFFFFSATGLLVLIALRLLKIYLMLRIKLPELITTAKDKADWKTLWAGITPVYPHVGGLESLGVYEVVLGTYTKFVRADCPFNALLISFVLEAPPADQPMAQILHYSEKGLRLGGYLAPVNIAQEWSMKIIAGITNPDSDEDTNLDDPPPPYEGSIQ